MQRKRSSWFTLLTLALMAFVPVSVMTYDSAQQEGAPLAPSGEKVKLPEGEVSLGSIRLPTAVMADGKRLNAGTYQLRLTSETAKPAVVGQLEKLERWVEILQGSGVKARAMASIVPGAAIKEVAEGVPPQPGKHRVEQLKGGDYLRIWINKAGDHVLLNLPLATGGK